LITGKHNLPKNFWLEYIYYSDNKWVMVDDWGGDMEIDTIEELFKIIKDMFASIYTIEIVNFEKKTEEEEKKKQNIEHENTLKLLKDIESFGIESFIIKCSRCGYRRFCDVGEGKIIDGCSQKKCNKKK
jgi:hypothetical protein